MAKLFWEPGTGNHKYKVTIDKNGKKKTVQFGNKDYQHYKDTTPLKLYSYLDHNDKDRKQSYFNRHSKVRLKDGTPAYLKKYTPAWFSMKYLWS